MSYPTYLVHFNANHDKLGRFDRGDGDHDGIVDDHHYKKLDRMSDKRLYKTLKKEVQNKRGEVHGFSSRWARLEPIGEKSKQVTSNALKLEKEYKKSPEYKKWMAKGKALERKMEAAPPTKEMERLEEEWFKWEGEAPKKNFNTLYTTYIYDGSGKHGVRYVDDFLNKGGKDLSIAYLEDLGYSKEKAKEYVKRLIEDEYTLASV